MDRCMLFLPRATKYDVEEGEDTDEPVEMNDVYQEVSSVRVKEQY